MEPQITISLSEYNRLVESDRQLQDKTHCVFVDMGPGGYRSSWKDVISNDEAVDKLIRANQFLDSKIGKLHREKEELERKLSERGLFRKLFG